MGRGYMTRAVVVAEIAVASVHGIEVGVGGRGAVVGVIIVVEDEEVTDATAVANHCRPPCLLPLLPGSVP